MRRSSARYAVYATLLVVYLLHNDLWLWNDPRIVLGLPVGLTYHVGFNLLAALTMFLLVRFAWPEELEAMDDVEPPGDHGIPTADELVGGTEPSDPSGDPAKRAVSEDSGGSASHGDSGSDASAPGTSPRGATDDGDSR